MSGYGAPWWNTKTIAIVTGANKGIGFEIARKLSGLKIKTVVAARNDALGQSAADKIRQATGNSEVLFHQLDISSAESVGSFAEWAKAELGNIDILVNNAGLAFKGNAFSADMAQATMDVNFYGTARVCEAVSPFMRSGSRIVNVSSSSGKLARIPGAHLRERFAGVQTKQDVVDLAEKFVADIRAGKHEAEGWGNSMYGISKACETAYTRVLARELESRGILVNACNPGWCATDMSSWSGPKSAEDGADTPVWLALYPPGTGGIYDSRKPMEL